jgi:Pentapeptide repeats (8 copies)
MYEWIVAGTLVVTSLAAVAALFFTRQSIQATNSQLRISEQGQITDRYNAAIANLGSRSIDIRLGGIYALQRLMQDSPRDQPTVIAVLCAFVRDRTMPNRKPHKPPVFPPPTDIQAALTVVGTRNAVRDGRTTVDLDNTQLAKAELAFAKLASADLHGADLRGADLLGTNLDAADLHGADLRGALIERADLRAADLRQADLRGADIERADLQGAVLLGTNLSRAFLGHADFRGALIDDVDFRGADLTSALWPATPVPPGWQRDTDSGRLKRAGTAAAN